MTRHGIIFPARAISPRGPIPSFRILVARLIGRAIDDPDLGLLVRRGDWWTRAANGTVPVSILTRGPRPDDGLRAAAATAVAGIGGLEARARSFIGATRGANAATGLSLVAVAVLRPSKGWIDREVEPHTASAAAALREGTPAVSLQFRGDAERGVLHVTLVDGVPVEADHH
ncbi:MAG TPA: hypothetical protein VHM67_11425 [Gemmatimonadaceae bacterium]|nr:hypothetical protein [Gemmatimonadaceae bacterium]